MDDFVIFENGVIRLTVRQLTDLWLDVTDRCDCSYLIDVKQPDSFTDILDWSVFSNSGDL